MKSTQEKYNEAENAFAEGRYQDALAICREIPESAEEWLDAQALIAECYVESAEWKEAERTASMVLAKDPQWGTGYLIRGLAALEHNRIDDADQILKDGWKVDDTIAESAWLLGVICDFRGRFEEGNEWRQRAHILDRDFPSPFHVDTATIDSMLLSVVEEYDEATLDSLDESRFRITPMPTPAELGDGTTIESTHRLEELDAEGDPPTLSLTLYQRNLERNARHKGELKRILAEIIEDALTELVEAVEALDEGDGSP